MFDAIAACSAQLISYSSLPLSSVTLDELWSLFHKNQSLFFTELLGTYLNTQLVLFVIVSLATLTLFCSLVFNFVFVILRFGCDKCKGKRYQQHPTSTSLYAVLMVLFYALWFVGSAATTFYVYVAFFREPAKNNYDFEAETTLTQNTQDELFELLDRVRDLAYSTNALYSMEWVFHNVVRYTVFVNGLILIFAAYATVVGTICYRNSRHPMDRSNTSNTMHNILALCSGATWFLLSALILLSTASFLYAHVHQNTCEEFQLRMQNENIERFLNGRNVTETDVVSVSEMLADMAGDRRKVNADLCEATGERYQTVWLSTMLIAVTSILLKLVMTSLSKFYMQVDSIYYWNPEDPYSTLRMFQCNKDSFPHLPVTMK